MQLIGGTCCQDRSSLVDRKQNDTRLNFFLDNIHSRTCIQFNEPIQNPIDRPLRELQLTLSQCLKCVPPARFTVLEREVSALPLLPRFKSYAGLPGWRHWTNTCARRAVCNIVFRIWPNNGSSHTGRNKNKRSDPERTFQGRTILALLSEKPVFPPSMFPNL